MLVPYLLTSPTCALFGCLTCWIRQVHNLYSGEWKPLTACVWSESNWRKVVYNEVLHNSYFVARHNVVKRVEHVARVEEGSIYRILVSKQQERIPFANHRLRLDDNIKMENRFVRFENGFSYDSMAGCCERTSWLIVRFSGKIWVRWFGYGEIVWTSALNLRPSGHFMYRHV